ncbi:MAG: GGDEF and EAL domain-containing protein, partial [Oscillospiraceae bacterium]
MNTVTLLGYKEKSMELTQAMNQEQQYRNAITKDAIIFYEINVTKNAVITGFESMRQDVGDMVSIYDEMFAYMANKLIYPDDINRVTKYAASESLIREFNHGNTETSIEYRRLTDTQEYIWVRSVANLLENIETGDLIAYIYIKDIDKEKKRELELQRMAECDPLTGLYNKEVTCKLINEYLTDAHKSSTQVMLMIDVDNFKEINDHLSHAFGDAVLCELADKLRSIFRKNDILGRIGGDEFIAFIKGDASVRLATSKAEEVCKAFMIKYKGLREEYGISGSIGIVIAPKDGKNFEELYRNADAALYKVKNAGKNGYQLYDGSEFLGYESNRNEIQTEVTMKQKNFRQNRVEYVFKILYQSENSVEAIYSVLELVASHFYFERGYIFETSSDGKTTSNTFEWCADGIAPQRDNLQNLPIEIVSAANESFCKTGTYIAKTLDDLSKAERAVLQPQGIKAMFQFGIFDKRNLLGFIGFDNCSNELLPNDIEIDEIATICNILATFFVKQRNDKIAARDSQVRQSVMNHLNNLVYVINPKTFEVLFMNDQTRNRVGDVECNSPCYHFFRGNTEQCEDCPIRDMQDDYTQQVRCEIYNTKFKIWVETTASKLRWTDGSIVCLLESADITKQKQDHLQYIAQLEKLAFVDELTESCTFYKFKKDAQIILQKAQNTAYFLVKLDIDNFKLINQLYGYENGDEVLRCVARALKATVQSQDEIFARISNDEFIALFSMQDSTTIKTKHNTFMQAFSNNDFAFKFTFPYGIYVIQPSDMKNLDVSELFEKVNIAHKAAKADKIKKFLVYDESMTKEALVTKEIENKMLDALENNEFSVYLQPKYFLDTEMIGGAEALSRWKNENVDLFFPGAFIPVFEKNGFITKLDFYVPQKVCQIIKGC